MKRIEGSDYLYQRGGRYVVRVQVPADVRSVIGVSEFRRSVGADRVAARRKCHALIDQFQTMIERARASHPLSGADDATPSTIGRDEIDAAAYDHFRRMVTNLHGKGIMDVGGNPRSRANRAEGYRVMIENTLDAVESEAWSTIATQAEWLCEEKGWQLDRQSEIFDYLCQMMLRARLRCYRDELRRLEGKMAADPDADPAFGPEPPKRRAPRTLGALIDKFKADRSDKWTASTRKNYVIITRVLEEICGRDTSVDAIDKDFCRKVRDALVQLPSNYQKLPATKGRPIGEAIEIGHRLGLPAISPATINGHLNKLGAVIRFGRDEGWIVGNPMAKIEVNDPVHPSDKRDPFTTAQLNAIFTSAPWDRPFDPADNRPSRYWVPLIGLFTGARLTEICGQLVEEMIDADGVPAFNFLHRPGIREIKSGKGRVVPVHPELLRLGFWEFVMAARKSGRAELFPDVKRDLLGKWGDGTSKWFSRKIASLELKGRLLSFHSLRHTFEDALRRAELHDTPIGNALTGRWSAGVSKNYGTRYPITMLIDAVSRVSFSNLILSHK